MLSSRITPLHRANGAGTALLQTSVARPVTAGSDPRWASDAQATDRNKQFMRGTSARGLRCSGTP